MAARPPAASTRPSYSGATAGDVATPPERTPITEANDALSELTLILYEAVEIRHRIAANLARIAHPAPPLQLVDDDE